MRLVTLDGQTLESDESLWWDREIFRCPEAPDGRCPPTLDLTGRPRILLGGPWATLTPGLWRATVMFHLCEEAARRQLAVEVGASLDFNTVDVPRGRSGRQAVELVRFVNDGEPVEIRFWLKSPAFHGGLSFAGVKLERIGDQPLATATSSARG